MIPDQRSSAAHIDNEWALLSASLKNPADGAERMEKAMIEAAAAIHSYVTVRRLEPSAPEGNWPLALFLLNTIEELLRTP